MIINGTFCSVCEITILGDSNVRRLTIYKGSVFEKK
jgi:hypothetical protein